MIDAIYTRLLIVVFSVVFLFVGVISPETARRAFFNALEKIEYRKQGE